MADIAGGTMPERSAVRASSGGEMRGTAAVHILKGS